MKELTLRYIKGVGPKKAALLKKLGIISLNDLLYYFPARYQDRRSIKLIKDLKEGEPAVVRGEVLARSLRKIPYFVRTTKVRSIFEAVLKDETGRINCLWFNQSYLADLIKVNEEIIIYGKPSYSKGKLTFISPEYEVKAGDSLNLGRIAGIYRLTANLSQKFMRKTIYFSLTSFKAKVSDPLPFYIRKSKNILNIAKSLEEIHFPSCWESAEAARQRFIFEELFYSQILVYLRKAKHRLQKGISFSAREETLRKMRDNLTFKLTSSQEQVLSQITSDLAKSYPMHRLLQGDVGCGKTIVAVFALGICVDGGGQAAFMVPTEVLAHQHKETLKNIFKGLKYRVEILLSSLPAKKIKKIYRELKDGKINIIVGTHALIQEEVGFKKLGLVIIDEQHKFGVAQRALLPRKGKTNPHCLVMSATPIPRTLALSVYGDLDLSVIKELPKGRLFPETIWVKEKERGWVYNFLKEKISEGRQAYIIYPVIEGSEEQDLKSVEEMSQKIKEEFSSFKTGVFHGRMKARDKLEVIDNFRKNKINILLSTTVVEVGVNIENVTAMVVENPERFGLAQLHQLRGRIQRSQHKPYFILISKDSLSSKASERLKVIVEVNDGFRIAEEDLILRGPGEFFGLSQHGLPQLKIADPLRDLEILKAARSFAYKVIKSDPYLKRPPHRCLREHLEFWFKK